MISAVLVINERGEVVMYRAYRDDVTREAAEAFRVEVVARKETGNVPPVQLVDNTSFLHTRRNKLFFTAVTKSNGNPALIFEFLFQLQRVVAAYLGEDFSENDLRNNFTLIYELLDEALDFGYPQNCSIDVLKLYINLGKLREKVKSAEKAKQITAQITGAIDWRKPGVKHRHNEVYVNVMEEVSLMVSADGSVLNSEARGVLTLRTYLSGMPECQLALNDKVSLNTEATLDGAGDVRSFSNVELEDCTFHRCVSLGRFDTDRTVTFTPPDGEFELMRYRIATNISPPFRLIPVVEEHGKTKVFYNVRLLAQFPDDESARNVLVRIPCPPNTARAKPHVTRGRAKYDPAQHAILWRLRKCAGGSEASFTCVVETVPNTKEKPWSRPPIHMDFTIPMWAASGLKVRYLKVIEKSGYRAKSYVKYFSKASDSYQIRI
ncbi:AP-2 complex subunit mu [Hondaea fermentalgiana]|uniref:AP-2 complex subunit mu n=1 Tax=Hondaea fermentalgiana TaxID=2315210 RepID=A0A2R5GYF0_9STRA|nr:AP-2 complex subunit mu [Hondaea fermentalgiana]|eukprot:GBG33753.1 AP-2 complex subunit mu [Hondaea fermentalgiana]